MIFKYFHPFRGMSFHFLDGIIYSVEVFNFGVRTVAFINIAMLVLG